MNNIDSVHQGSCFCGQASYVVKGKPTLSAYCHCTLCQRLHAAPFIHTMHFPSSAFSWTHKHQNATHVYNVSDRPWKNRHRCANCGSPVASYNSKTDAWSVWGVQIARDENGKFKGWEELKPNAHIFYGTRVLNIDDELGKWDGYENHSNRIVR